MIDTTVWTCACLAGERPKSSGQWRIAPRSGTGAPWPSPQIEPFSIATSHSSSCQPGIAGLPSSSSWRTCSSPRVPMRHGVHFWHDSSAKKRIVSRRSRSTG